MVMDRDLTLGAKHTVQYAEAVLQKCMPGTYGILLTSYSNKLNKNLKNALFASPRVGTY